MSVVCAFAVYYSSDIYTFMTGPMLSDVPDHQVPDHIDWKPFVSNTCLTGLLQAVTLFPLIGVWGCLWPAVFQISDDQCDHSMIVISANSTC